jgi:GR25 family glycosyltransferase involved in LPS biosynthesis
LTVTTLVINVDTNTKRRLEISSVLESRNIEFNFVSASIPTSFLPEIGRMVPLAIAVWKSHTSCFEIAQSSRTYTLILEDDAQLHFTKRQLMEFQADMVRHDLDFLQIGFLKLHIFDSLSIIARNIYSAFIRNGLFTSLFSVLGLLEATRAKNQKWRRSLPKSYILNDIRYGAHCYLISPKFAETITLLNSPTFLSIDEFFISLSRMKSFKMARLSKSLCDQSETSWSDEIRFGIDKWN